MIFDIFFIALVRQSESISFRNDHLDDLTPTGNKGRQFWCLAIFELTNLGLYRLCKTGDHPRIDGIGFGQNASGFSKIAHLPRVNNNYSQPGFGKTTGCQ